MSEPFRVVHYGVHDRSYPRNSRVRGSLEADGVEVVVVERVRTGGRLSRAVAEVRGLWTGSKNARVVLLSEFRLTHAPLAWLVARLRGAGLVVDGFVGLHETVVGDQRAVSPRSFRARRLALADRLALRLADLFLIDTEVRAAAARRISHATPVLALPVGAPAWATPRGDTPSGTPLRVLYYGNYIPLHGLDLVADALDRLAGRRAFDITFVGDGTGRDRLEERAAAGAWVFDARFLDPVPEAELARYITDSHVVLGVFGSSEKARTVVANKVWQGLACGRTVVTQGGPALADIPEAVRELVVATEPGSAESLAEALATVATIPPAIAGVAAELIDECVSGAFAELSRWVRA